MKTKAFDCVEMKREGAERLTAQLSGMSYAEQMAFWRSRTEALRKRRHADDGESSTDTSSLKAKPTD